MQKQNLIIGASLVFGIAILFIAYQALVIMPAKGIMAQQRAEEARLEAERNERYIKQYQYELCISNAWEVYSTNWDNACVIDGKEADCTLPAYRHEPINQAHEADKDRCMKLFTAN